MPLVDHPSFDRPLVTQRLWRYMDLPKFVDMLRKKSLWLSNADILANNDPFEGVSGAVQFPHRLWKKFEDVPKSLAEQLMDIYGRDGDGTPESAFRSWVMIEEQRCIFEIYGRRDFFVSCWHAADSESIAMWQLYGAPGPGVAIITNGGRIENALSKNIQNFHLGSVVYRDTSQFTIGSSNVFESIMRKRDCFEFEKEVRLVYWNTEDMHDPLQHFKWNENSMRFEDLVEDERKVTAGLALECDLDILIEKAIVSPFAPEWHTEMIIDVRDRFSCKFPVYKSRLLSGPTTID